MEEPSVPPAPPPTHDRGRAALEGAGMSVLVGMQGGAATRDGFGFLLFTALGIAAAPFVALGKAIAAPVGTDVQDAAREISGTITRVHWDRALRDAVEQALDKHAKPIVETPSADSSRLKLTVEGPWLVLDSYTAVPTLTVHGELARGEACLLDRRWRWNGDGDHFVDLGEDQAEDYRTQMEGALGLLADAIVSDILGTAPPRETAYRDETVLASGGRPLVATDPVHHQEQIGAWDKTAVEAAREPRCGGIGPAKPPPAASRTETCQGLGCRNI
jgi:hypothetical protein